MMSALQKKSGISIVITENERKQAQKAAQAVVENRAEEVYRNTLSVLAIHKFLRMSGIKSDLSKSYSCQPFRRMIEDTADLLIPGRGRLECRSLMEGDTHFTVPLDVWDERIGYVAVQFSESFGSGKVLGFVPSVSETRVSLSKLESLEGLIEHLYKSRVVVRLGQLLKDTEAYIDSGYLAVSQLLNSQLTFATSGGNFRGRGSTVARRRSKRGALSQSPLELDFSAIDETAILKRAEQALFSPEVKPIGQMRKAPLAEPQFKDEASIEMLEHLLKSTNSEEVRWRAAELLWMIDPDATDFGVRKELSLDAYFPEQNLVLMIGVLPIPDWRPSNETDGADNSQSSAEAPAQLQVAILLRVYARDETVLPEGLKLAALDDQGNTIRDAKARTQDRIIQRKLRAELDDSFQVEVSFEDESFTESFVI